MFASLLDLFVLSLSLLALLLLAAVSLKSVHRIGPNEVGLVIRRVGRAKTSEGPVEVKVPQLRD